MTEDAPSTLTDTDRRREWAAALRWAAAEAARPFGGAQDGDLDSTDLREFADQIEAGAAPWPDTAPETAPSATETADQPTPGTVAPPDRQGAAEGLREDVGYHVFRAVDIGDTSRAAALAVADDILQALAPAPALAERAVIDAARAWRAQFAPGPDPVRMPRRGALIAAVDALDNAAVNTPDGVNGAEAVDLDAAERMAADSGHGGGR